MRYRGYYLDNETNYYYLQSRYYNPEICRFLNADDVDYIESYTNMNTFSYCNNNPVMLIDAFGTKGSIRPLNKSISPGDRKQIMDYAWSAYRYSGDCKFVFSKYGDYKGSMSAQTIRGSATVYTYLDMSRKNIVRYTNYYFVKKKVSEWKKLCTYKNKYNAHVFNI